MKRISILLLIIGICMSMNAQIFVNINATGANDGSTWADAYTDLNDAINAAQAGDQLWVAAGTYLPGNNPGTSFTLNQNLEIYGGFAGSETMLSQRNDSANITLLSGDINGDDLAFDLTNNRDDNARHIMTLTNFIDNSTIIDGIHFRGGHADTTGAFPATKGGAIISSGNPVIRNCHFTDNFAKKNGGAIHVLSTPTSGITITSSRFIQNAAGARGGAIFAINIPGTNNLIKDCLFESNRGDISAGALRIVSSSITVEGSRFLQNQSNIWGGAVSILQNTNSLDVNFHSCEFDGNTSARGGAVYIEMRGLNASLTVDSSQFMNNIARDYDNYVPGGGGILVFFAQNSDNVNASFNNCVFDGNEADKFGGGLMSECLGTYCSVDVQDCAFLSNQVNDPTEGSGSACSIKVYNIESSINIEGTDFQENTGGLIGSCAIEALESGELDGNIKGCHFNKNESSFSGAALSLIAYPNAIKAKHSVAGCSFSQNKIPSSPLETYGGAVAISSAIDSFEVMLTHSVFTENENPQGGAAIDVAELPGLSPPEYIDVRIENSLITGHGVGQAAIRVYEVPVSITNLTIADNAMSAIEVLDTGKVMLRNTILNSVNHNDITLNEGGSLLSMGGNLISDGSASQALTSADISDVDPGFEGGMDHPFSIGSNSPAIDLGRSYPGFDPMALDLAGNPRLQGNNIDAGAYESSFTTSIRDFFIRKDDLDMYPVPVSTTSTLTLDNDWRGPFSITVFNALGQHVLGARKAKYQDKITWKEDLSMLSPGTYRLVVSNETTAIVKPFVKK